MKILSFVMIIAPLGIFCLIGQTFATQGISSIFELMKYFVLVILVLLIHVSIVYLPIIKKYKCIYDPNGEEPEIDKVMESLRSIKD